jgi:molecular chaperone HscA
MAKLEVTFKVDADGLLSVEAHETTTGEKQSVSVKPSYGLDDATVEKMLLEALDHGEDDLHRRRLAEERVEAGRIARATKSAIEIDHALLAPGKEASIACAIEALENACLGEDPGKIHSLVEALDAASKEFATRRMNRAIARAIEGRKLDEVSTAMDSSGSARPPSSAGAPAASARRDAGG